MTNNSIGSVKTHSGISLEERLSNILIRTGIPPHIKGYRYLKTAVMMSMEEPENIKNITKRLYPAIADCYRATAYTVERMIRHAIETSWSKGKIKNINAIFGFEIYRGNVKPSNGDLIALLADRLYFEIDKRTPRYLN